jgi:hypothetical protein
MGADTVISGVIRGLLPYVAIGAAGFAGYTYLRKKGVFDEIGKTVDTVANVPKNIVDTVKDRLGADSFARGDFIGGAQTILRNTNPVINVAEKGYNAIKDNLPVTLPWEDKPKESPPPITTAAADLPQLTDNPAKNATIAALGTVATLPARVGVGVANGIKNIVAGFRTN